MDFGEDVIAEGLGLRDAVFGTGEIEDVAVSEEAPMTEASDVKTEIPAVLIADAGSFGESVAEGVVEPRRIIAV